MAWGRKKDTSTPNFIDPHEVDKLVNELMNDIKHRHDMPTAYQKSDSINVPKPPKAHDVSADDVIEHLEDLDEVDDLLKDIE